MQFVDTTGWTEVDRCAPQLAVDVSWETNNGKGTSYGIYQTCNHFSIYIELGLARGVIV